MIHRDHESSLDPQGANQVDDTQAGHTGEGVWQRGLFRYDHRQPYSVSCEHPRHRAGFVERLGFTRHICVCVVCISPRRHADMYHTGSWKVTRAEDWVEATHSTDRHWAQDQGLGEWFWFFYYDLFSCWCDFYWHVGCPTAVYANVFWQELVCPRIRAQKMKSLAKILKKNYADADTIYNWMLKM